MDTPSEPVFDEMLSTYRGITEPEFRQVKEWIVQEATRKLRNLAETKSSGELGTAEFYAWLLPAIAGAPRGSEVWAVSLLPDCEYDGSVEEEAFLRENIEAARRGVSLRRVFVIPTKEVDSWLLNKGVLAHRENLSGTLGARVTSCEYLEKNDSSLLRVLGDGLIAFDNRVAQRDIVAPDGSIRGRVTMEAVEIAQLRKAFESLWIQARDIAEVFESREL